MRDLRDRADVDSLVIAFYRAAFADPLIGPIFTDIAKMDLDHHLPIIGDFWQTVLFGSALYRRNALRMHQALNARVHLGHEEFDRWLSLWTACVDTQYAGPVAERAKLQAGRIAGSMQRRLAGRSGSAFETITRG
ncbi:MAG: group III truncated hemoglobin [Pseudolysinimonas sp.]